MINEFFSKVSMIRLVFISTLFFASVNIFAASFLEISLKNEIDVKDGSYIVKEFGGQGRYALINHRNGRFEVGDIANAECSDGYLVSKLPAKFSKLSKFLKQTDFVFTSCKEA